MPEQKNVGVWGSNGKLVGGRDCCGPYEPGDFIEIDGVTIKFVELDAPFSQKEKEGGD
jgi:hypothetical protein